MAFSNLWEVARAETRYQHHRRFMLTGPRLIPLGEALHGVDANAVDGPAESTDASVMPGPDPLDKMVWTGGFVFSFDSEPQAPHIGWRCGYGRWSKDPGIGRVDLALCLPEDRMKSSIHGNHVFFNFLGDSAAFAIHTLHPTSVDGQMVAGTKNYRVLNRASHVVSIGEMSYTFNYTVPSDQIDAFTKRRAAYMRDILSIEAPLISATPTPSEKDIYVGRWRLIQTIGSGSESVVASAISGNGDLVAVKQIGSRRTAKEKQAEIERYKRIWKEVTGEGAQFLIAFYDSVESHLGVLYTFFQPLVRHDFTTLLNSSVDAKRPVLAQLFLQAMIGVGALHKAGFMHRDLKPANLGVRSMDPPHAVVLDLGSALWAGEDGDLAPTPGCFGTIGYLAPEVENINLRYGIPADIWSMGCVGLQLLIKRHFGPYLPWRMSVTGSPNFNPWRSAESFTRAPFPDENRLQAQRDKYQNVLQGLDNSGDGLERLLLSMLYENPDVRCRARQVADSLFALKITEWPQVDVAQ